MKKYQDYHKEDIISIQNIKHIKVENKNKNLIYKNKPFFSQIKNK